MGFVGKPPASVSHSASSTQVAWAALSMPLRECGEIAGLRLSSILSDALRQATELLFSEGTQALTPVEREAMLDAAEFARARRDGLVADFRKHFEQRYVRACQRQPTLVSGYRIDFDVSQLQIVEHDLLDDALDPGMLAEAIQNASWGSLHDLTKCFGQLLGAEALNSSDIPLSPRLIEAAVSDAARDQPGRHDAKFRLIRSLRKYLPTRVGQFYRDLTEHLKPMARQVNKAVSCTSVAAYGQAEDGPLEHLPEMDSEMSRVAIDLAPSNEAVELALAVAHILVARQQAQSLAPLDRSEAGCPQDVLAALPEPLAQAEPQEVIQPIAQDMSPSGNEQIGAAQAAAVLPELESGTWLEFREVDGSLRELKLAWISPRKSLYLMTNRQGARALSMVAEDFAAALREGRARIVMPRETTKPASIDPGQHPKKTA